MALTSSSLLLGAVINEWREWIRERKSVCERVKMIERERERERERESQGNRNIKYFCVKPLAAACLLGSPKICSKSSFGSAGFEPTDTAIVKIKHWEKKPRSPQSSYNVPNQDCQ